MAVVGQMRGSFDSRCSLRLTALLSERAMVGFVTGILICPAAFGQAAGGAAKTTAAVVKAPILAVTGAIVPGRFVETTAASGVTFTGVASHTSKKYLMETMGSGVAMFDFDNDGLEDLFFVNGAPIADPTVEGDDTAEEQGRRTGTGCFIRRRTGRSRT